MLVEHHAHGKAGAVFALYQRTKIIRDALGQHGHDAIREISGVAALLCFAVHCGAGADIGCHIRNGDDGNDTTFIFRIRVGAGPYSGVMVARICRVDGDERNVTEIGAAF